jgi:hypothetical protein
MHTPGHATLNLAILGAVAPSADAGAVLLGAIAPDLPIMVLYLRERWLRGTPEEQIWSVAYQRRFWQDLIHGAHSIPLALAGALVAWALSAPFAAAFFSSALLHALEDLPVHATDAHRHFLPLSQVRFVSPLSYWDVRFHGRAVALAEALLVTLAAVYLASAGAAIFAKIALGAVVAFYILTYWRSFLRRHAAAQGTFF